MSPRKLRRAGWLVAVTLLTSCGQDQQPPLAPQETADLGKHSRQLATTVRRLAAEREVGRMPPPPRVRPALVRLGQALAFDKILSGNRDISCMTCHLPALGTGDARSLSIGQGGAGLGKDRVHPEGAFIPRNAPPLFNLTAMTSLFWDGRVSMDESGQLHTPAGEALTPEMEAVLEFGPVSAIGLFPVLSREEMRAMSGNELADIPDDDLQGVWAALMRRLGAIPEYRRLFEAAYRGTRFEEMTFAHASNAIGGFLIAEFSFADSPWDRFLRGEDRALDREQMEGAETFLTIRCSLCHNGPAFTDNQFHNVAVAQFGPGKGNGPDGNDDFGRMNVTGDPGDRYRFRTTPLRNVELTGPYGHDGALSELRDFIDHYSESDVKLRTFSPLNLEPLLQGTLLANADDILATRDEILDGVVLPEETVDQLTSFMSALTDPASRRLDRVVPRQVPSGLPIDRP